MDIPLTPEDQDFIEKRVRSNEYPSVDEALRDGLRSSRVHDSSSRPRYEAWRQDARRKIDEGFEQSERGEMIDGEEAFERLRLLIESWKA